MEETISKKCKEFKLRIGNLGISKAGYLCEEPSHPSYHINKFQKNPHYGKEDEYEWSEDGSYAYKPESPYWRINKSCFEHPETCYAIAEFEYDEHEDFYEIRFVGDRPFDLNEEEREIFWDLLQTGNAVFNKSNNFDFSKDD